MDGLQGTGDYRTINLANDGFNRHFTVPAYGILRRIEIRPTRDLPNTDSGSPYRLALSFIGGNGEEIPFEIVAIVESVADPAWTAKGRGN